MRQFAVAFFVLALILGGMSATAYATSCYKQPETAIDKAGDWFATFGKNRTETKRILAQRKRDRLLACIKKELETRRRSAGV